MGTRADFYVGRGEHAEWLGSIAYDGHPDSAAAPLWKATSEEKYRKIVQKIIDTPTGTRPEQGWPWPWEDSRTTDYAYAFDVDEGIVWVSAYGHAWCRYPEEDWTGEKVAVFPDMTARQKVAYGERSGILILTGK